MKVIITEEQSRMLINHVISEKDNINDMGKVREYVNMKKSIECKNSNINK